MNFLPPFKYVCHHYAALITGAFVERVKFKSFCFQLLWANWYISSCHWYGDRRCSNDGRPGFCRRYGCSYCCGFSALAFALVIGPRKGPAMFRWNQQHPLTVLGTGLLWIGWFALCRQRSRGKWRGGQRSGDNQYSAASAGIIWMLLSWLDGRPSIWASPQEWSSSCGQ